MKSCLKSQRPFYHVIEPILRTEPKSLIVLIQFFWAEESLCKTPKPKPELLAASVK
ncbi:hypothetical protein GBA52_003503, partial [Prunus armeniaca]